MKLTIDELLSRIEPAELQVDKSPPERDTRLKEIIQESVNSTETPVRTGGYKRRKKKEQKKISWVKVLVNVIWAPIEAADIIREKVDDLFFEITWANWIYITKRAVAGTAIALLGIGAYKFGPTMNSVAEDKYNEYMESGIERRFNDYELDFKAVQEFVSRDDYIAADDLSKKLQRQLDGETNERFNDLSMQVLDYDDEVVDTGYEQFQVEIRVAEMQTQNAIPANTAVPTPLPEVTLEATIVPTLASNKYPPVFISEADGGVYRSDGINVSLITNKPEDAVWELAVLSPDERRALLVERVEKFLTSMCNIYVINTDGSRLSYLEDTRNGWCFVDMFWTDNDSIIYQYGRNNGAIGVRWQMDIDENNIGRNKKRYSTSD